MTGLPADRATPLPAPPPAAGDGPAELHHRTPRARFGGLLFQAIGDVFASLARLTVVALFVTTFLLQPSQIPSSSMEPTMLVGDFVLVNKQVFADPGHFRWLLPFRDPRIDDIIVFHYPVNPRELLVKRVIALPGDRIHLQNGHVLRNDVRVLEPFAVYRPAERSPFRDEFPNLQRTDPAVQATWWIELRHRMQYGALPVPPNRYFALGDNRNNSQDSRYWGFVARSTIIGEPLAIYLSVDRSPQASGGKPSRGRIRWNRLLHVVY